MGLDVHKDSIGVASAAPGRGPATAAGDSHARRLLTEAAWNHRFKPRIGKEMQARQEGLSETVRTIAWQAQLRLTPRFKALQDRGVQADKACIAVARELAGFIWAIVRQAQSEQVRRVAAHPSSPLLPARGKECPKDVITRISSSIR